MWNEIKDNDVRSIWRCADEDCECQKEEVTWDFELDNIINIPAIDGVDPENLTDEQCPIVHELLLEKLKVLIQSRDITFQFEKTFEHVEVGERREWADPHPKANNSNKEHANAAERKRELKQLQTLKNKYPDMI